MNKNIYNISATLDFHAYLAEKFAMEYKDKPLELSDVLFLMPSKRAVSSLRNAFLQVFELKPMILPQIMAVSDFDEDELLLKVDNFSDIKQAMSNDERMFYFIRLIMQKHGVNLNQAYQLAMELSSMFDEATNLGVDLSALMEIIPDDFSKHKQEMFEFLKILTQNWPLILAEKDMIDNTHRNKQILQISAQNILKSGKKVVFCAISAPFLAIKEFLKTFITSADAQIYFYGIDMCLNDDEWQNMSDIHPSFENKQMLDYLEIDRKELVNIGFDEIKDKFISELMRPAQTSDAWQNIDKKLVAFFENINFIEAENLSDEALKIAILIKKHIDEDKEVALVCPDRNLSRRVCSELKRFDVEVDDTAGRPLLTTALGVFMRLVLENVCNGCDVVSFLSLVKHPYFTNKSFVKEYERVVLRHKKEDEELSFAAQSIKNGLVLPERASLKEMLSCHIKLCQVFCEKLFVKEEGRIAAQLFSGILENSYLIDDVSLSDYKDYFDTLISGVAVRNMYSTHPKIKILGPIEARFNKFDVAIIGACNEGMWPMAANANPWLSDSMKKELGLQTHSYKVGINALDFASILASDNVYISRSIKVDGTPQVKSRFLLKLDALTKLLDYENDGKVDYIYKKMANLINKPQKFENIEPPMPRPKVEFRPKEISASQVETLIKDPYAIYAKKILKLYKLDDINQELDASDYGTIIHEILEEFYKQNNTHFPPNAKEQMMAIGEAKFLKYGLKPEVQIFWKARLNKVIEGIIKAEHQYSVDVSKRHSEISSSLCLGDYTISAKADRIDELNDGNINIIDYKTGGVKSKKEIYAGYAPQLPVEGLIFAEHFNTDVSNLIYWQLGKKEAMFNDDLDALFLKTKERLLELLSAYEDEDVFYQSCPDADYMPRFSDYEHLARLKEWAVKGDFDD